MRYIVYLFLSIFIMGTVYAQEEPHAFSIGSSIANDFGDGFGWYSSGQLPLSVSTLSYTYTLRKPKNHIQFSIAYIDPISDGYTKNQPLFELYSKYVFLYNINYIMTLHQFKFLELQGKAGLLVRSGSASFITHHFSFDSSPSSVSYDSFGINLGGCTMFHLPFNFFVKLDADFAYYFYHRDFRTQTFNVFPPNISLYLGVHIGYEFGGKKREKKQFE